MYRKIHLPYLEIWSLFNLTSYERKAWLIMSIKSETERLILRQFTDNDALEHQIISVREHPDLLDRAVDYFSSKWGVDRQIYRDSISDSITTKNPLPRWYLMLKSHEIIGSFVLIENDFMVRKDLKPWLCALYVEEGERGKELGALLLSHARKEAKALGFDKVYLCTDHVGYYEKYGWRFFGMEDSEWGGQTRVYEIESEE